MSAARPKPRYESAVLVAGILGGLLFFGSLDRLWPLVDHDLTVPTAERIGHSREVLEQLGWNVADYTAASRLTVDEAALRWLQRRFGARGTQDWIEAGVPLASYVTTWKRHGDPTVMRTWWNAEQGLIGFSRAVERDQAGARLEEAMARELAQRALVDLLDLNPAELEERSLSVSEERQRRDFRLRFEREHPSEPVVREVVDVWITGDQVSRAVRWIDVPAEEARLERAGAGPSIALETVGFLAVAIFVGAAFVICLRGLRDGRVSIGRALVWPGVVLVGLLLTHLLDRAHLVRLWDPLIPRWIADFQNLVLLNVATVWILVVLVAVVAAGDALDVGKRGRTLWLLARGRWTAPGVGLASARGFVVGLLCGGTLAATTLLVTWATQVDAIPLQPRHFFFYTLNTASPALTSVAFFLGVALGEELGYRYFGGNWLMGWSGRAWVAIWVPALVYGLTHTRLEFLPPSSPWWGRALVLTCVGAVWGWAYLRYDALTVVLSHLTADLFIFNWPLLASPRLDVRAIAVATVAVPLIPALLGWIIRSFRLSAGAR